MESIIIDSSEDNNIDFITLKKMKFIYNAIESGWSVKLVNNKYIFTKKHEGKKEVYLDDYLNNFIKSNIN